jgi:hypothetical protein
MGALLGRPSIVVLNQTCAGGNIARFIHIFLQARALVHNVRAKTLQANLKIGEKPVESTLRFAGQASTAWEQIAPRA